MKVWEENQKKQGPEIVRKGGLVINTGDNPTKASIYRKREANKKKFGLSVETVARIKLPRFETKEWLKVLTLDQIVYNPNANSSTIEKLNHLHILEEALERKLKKINFLKERNSNNFKRCHLVICVNKTKGQSIFDEVFELEDVKFIKAKVFNPTGHKIFNENAQLILDD